MKITITISEAISNKSFDIQVDNRQRIKTTLKVLSENIAGMEHLANVNGIQIKSSGRQVSGDDTYENVGVYTGMELIVTLEKER